MIKDEDIRRGKVINQLFMTLISQNKYSSIERYKEFGKGELDLVAIREKEVIVYQVSSLDTEKSFRKARKQLEKAKRHYIEKGCFSGYYVTPNKLEKII
jgi:Holliday junction resolvase-like predicted endonuclease